MLIQKLNLDISHTARASLLQNERAKAILLLGDSGRKRTALNYALEMLADMIEKEAEEKTVWYER